VAAGSAGLNVSTGGSILQTAGTLSSNGQTTLSAINGDISQTSGVVGGANVTIESLTESTAVQGFGGGRTITVTAGTVACDCTGVIPAFPTLPALGPVATGLGHLLIDVTNGGYAFSHSLIAGWIEFHTLGNTTENSGGALNATLLSGTAGYTAASGFTAPGMIASASFTASGNAVRTLGATTAAYLTTGNFLLNDTGALTVGGSVQAGSALGFGQTIALTAPTLAVDASGSAFTAAGLSFTTAGSLVTDAAVAAGGGGMVVTPGQILLQADNFSIVPAVPATPLIVAPDGFLAIAPLTAGNTITVQGSSAGPGNLVLGSGTASLGGISTLGALLPGTPATDTLALGSLDAGRTTPHAGAIVFNLNGGTIDLTGVSSTIQLDATGPVTEAGVGSLRMVGLAGQAGSFALAPPTSTSTNSIAAIGNATTRVSAGVTYQTSGVVTAALGDLTDLLATGGNVQVHDNAAGGTLAVIGTVSAPSGQIVDLASPALVIDHL
ncbi:MAG: beta strand repeat-containing protein, partial [Acetobacteraceae bacterium]